MRERSKIIVGHCTFFVVYIGGLVTFWSLPGLISEASPVFAIVWLFATSKGLKWFFVRIGWTTNEREK
jgi:hypothetical protein